EGEVAAYEKEETAQTSVSEDLKGFSTRFSTAIDGKCRGKLLTSRLINSVLITSQTVICQQRRC
ncbi:MAG: hypothetical protein K2G30_10355, partial [Muribaculaceae bacterium]|nr:hypothetical protein [Muribaculaceae bacterium]